MKTPISILSWGVVSPGGTGIAALENSSTWPQALVPQVADPTRTHPVATIDLNATPLNRWRLKPRLRRASPISHYLIEAAAQALEAHPEINRTRVGLVSASFWGCLLDSVRFYRQFQKEGRRFASPALFPETVANSPLSHVVSELKIGGPVYSQLGDKSCWTTALRTAVCWLRNNDAEHVLVLGAEEFEPHALDAFQSAHWLKQGYSLPLAQGAGAVLLGTSTAPDAPQIRELQDGFSFRSRTESRSAAVQCLAHFNAQTPVMDSATGWMQSVAAETTRERPKFQGLQRINYEAFAASCAWDTIRAAHYLRSNPNGTLLLPFWGLTQQIGAAFICGAASR